MRKCSNKGFVSSVLIRNRLGLILVFESQDGFAALPGGSSEFREKPEETAIRESFEETGLRVNIEKMVAFYDLIVLNKDGTERCRFPHYLFLASTMENSPKPSSEWKNSEAKCKWIKLEDLRHYRKVWPLPENVRTSILISEGEMNLGNLGDLKYQME